MMQVWALLITACVVVVIAALWEGMRMDSVIFWACQIAIVTNIGLVIVNIIILRACQKMYTEYFKDRSMGARSNKTP